jgi:hypothetical protein
MVVQPGQDRDGDNDTGPLHRPTQGCILAQRQVRTNLIVVQCAEFLPLGNRGFYDGLSIDEPSLSARVTKAQGISSPGTHEAILMWSRNDGELRWSIMSDWTCR